MRILIDLTSLADNFSGIERFALSITKELIKDDSYQYVLVFKNKVHSSFANNYNNVDKVVIRGLNKLFFNQILLPFKLISIKADYYLFLAFPAPFFFFKKKVINTIHDLGCWDCPSCNKKYMIWYFKLMFWKASLNGKKLITVSKFSKQRIIEILHLEESNITVLYNGISDSFINYCKTFEKNLAVKEKYNLPDKYFLCLSTLEPRKNLGLLINAYLELVSEGLCPFELVLAGRKGWMMDELLCNIDFNLINHIHFTDFIDEEDLPSVYSLADCFIFPSLYEGFGIPPIEAMSVETRVISSDSSALPEVLGTGAIYFKNNSKEDLKKKILYVMKQNEDEKKNQLKNGLDNCNRFKWSYSAQSLLKLMNIRF